MTDIESLGHPLVYKANVGDTPPTGLAGGGEQDREQEVRQGRSNPTKQGGKDKEQLPGEAAEFSVALTYQG